MRITKSRPTQVRGNRATAQQNGQRFDSLLVETATQSALSEHTAAFGDVVLSPNDAAVYAILVAAREYAHPHMLVARPAELANDLRDLAMRAGSWRVDGSWDAMPGRKSDDGRKTLYAMATKPSQRAIVRKAFLKKMPRTPKNAL